MSDINWQEDTVCYANGKLWVLNGGSIYSNKPIVSDDGSEFVSFEYIMRCDDFQLNEITIGDYITTSEIDTEQKYNEVVEALKLHGVTGGLVEDKLSYQDIVGMFSDDKFIAIHNVENEVCAGFVNDGSFCKRKMFFNHIIAIGKLKRMMLDREKSAPKTTPDLTPDKQKSAVDYLTECVEVQKQRGEQYDSTGTGERSFDAAAKAYNALTGGNLKGSDVCLILTCVKAVRQYSNPNRLHEDSLLDLVSYASLWAEELNKELK